MITAEWLESCPDALVEIYAQIESDIIADMARKIKETDLLVSSAEWKAKKLAEMGTEYKEILKRLAKATGKTEAELKKLLKEVGIEAVKPSQAVASLLNTGLRRTMGSFENLTRSTAYNATMQYSRALDRAFFMATSGAFSQDEAVRTVVQDLASQGLVVIDYGTRTDYIDTVVRRAVRTGVAQTAGAIALQNAEDLGTDLVEVSAHSGARPSHADWQGKIYSVSGNSEKYPKLSDATGYGTVTGLCGANCRHTFYPYVEGDERAYSEAELAEMDAPKYEYNGKMLTEYEATQVQRGIERNIRKYKREKQAMDAIGKPSQAGERLKVWQQRLVDFTKQTGLKRQYSRENVPKIGAGIKIGKAERLVVKSPTDVTPPTSKQLTAKEKDAIEYYVSGDGMYINSYLRNGEALDSQSKKLQEELDSAISKYKVDEDVLYRAVDASSIFGNLTNMDYGHLRSKLLYDNWDAPKAQIHELEAKFGGVIGKEITELAYMSTTVSREVAENWWDMTGSEKPIVLRLSNTKGVEGFPVKDFFEVENDEQYEVLLRRKLRYKVKNIYGKDGTIFVDCEFIS